MTDPELDDRQRPEPAEPVVAEEILGLDPDLVRDVAAAMDEGRFAEVDALIEPLHYAEVAGLLEQLDGERRQGLVEHLSPTFDAEILPELDETVRDEVVDQLGTPALARALARLESDDALNLISSLDEHRQRQVVFALPAALRDLLESHLAFPEESAGRLMQRDVVAVPSFWTVGETIDYMREAEELPNDFYDLYVVDPRHRPVGTVPLNRLLRTKRPVRIDEIMETSFVAVPATMDQEDVAYIFKQQDLVSAPVVDEAARLIGVIMVDDVVDVIHDEAEEDLMRLGGVREGDLYSGVADTIRARLPWLSVNLMSAFFAALVISLFEDTIAKIVVLAVLMPIVASMGGNAGVQSVTVTVRAIAMKELTFANARRNLGKAALVGMLNGLIFATLIGLVTWAWSGEEAIGGVIGVAVIGTLGFATVLGTAIPIALTRIGVDPAVASGPTLTTITDSFAFLSFLGLATLLLT